MPKGLIRLDEVESKDVDWIWAERIAREEIHFIAGRRDVGKGLMVAKIAADVTRGRDPITGDVVQDPLNVLYSTKEDNYSTMTRPRMEAQGVDRSRVHLHKFRLPLDFEEVADLIIKLNVSLVIMDPLASHLSGGITRFADNIRHVTDPLKELAEATRTAWISVDHTIKRVGQHADPIDAVGGASSGFPAACKMGFLYGPDPQDEDRRILAAVKHNLREKPMALQFEIDSVEVEYPQPSGATYTNESVPKLLYVDEDWYNPIKLVQGGTGFGTHGRGERRSEASEWLVGYLWRAMNKIPNSDGSMPPSYPVLGKTVQDDALADGMAYRTLRRAADDLQIVKKPPRGYTCKWSLPDSIVQVLTGELDKKSNPTSEDAEVAQYLGEEPALKAELDRGGSLNADPEDWERNKFPEPDAPDPDAPAPQPDAMDQEIADLLASFEDTDKDTDEPTT